MMYSLDQDLSTLTSRVVNALKLPPIREVVLPERMLSVSEAQAKHDKFGIVVLQDGSAGFFYRLLDVQLDQLEAYRNQSESLRNCSVDEAIELLQSDDTFHRALALGAINAVTQALLKASGFELPAKSSAVRQRPELATTSASPDANARGASVGMVGYFRQQVESLRSQGYKVVVLELNPEFHCEQSDLLVSNDISSLDSCARVYCTASTLINNSLEGLLGHLSSLQSRPHIEVVGPSAGCFPDALFARGAAVVGGSFINDIETTCERVRYGKPWLDAVTKFSLSRQEYPGIEELLRASS